MVGKKIFTILHSKTCLSKPVEAGLELYTYDLVRPGIYLSALD